MPTSKHWKKLTLEMSAIILVSMSIGLVLNRGMLMDKWRGRVSPSASPAPVMTAPGHEFVPAGLSQVRELFENKQAVFVDARESSAFTATHIKGAVSLPLGDAARLIPDFLRKYSPSVIIVVYCSGYGCHDSGQLARKFLAAGAREVLVFEGGIPEWKDAGLPVEGTAK